MSTFYASNDYRIYLAHHGVKGMKWGVRHDRRPSGTSRRSGVSVKKGLRLTDGQKRALKIGATVVVAGLAIYGGYKLSQAVSRSGLSTEKVGDIPKLFAPKALSTDKIPKSVREAFGNLDANNPLRKADDVEHNCTNVFLAAVARMRGMDVTPGYQKDASGRFVGVEPGKIFECFTPQTDNMGNSLMKASKGKFCDSAEKVAEVIKKRARAPEGSYGYLSSTFERRGAKFNHAVMWQIKDGKMVFGDGINGLNAEKYFSMIDPEATVNFFRCDNLEFVTDELQKYVKS